MKKVLISFILVIIFCSAEINSQINNSGSLENDPLPIELLYFRPYILPNSILLKWATATEIGNYGFEVQRKFLDSPFTSIGFVPGSGNSNSPKYYQLEDKDIPQAGTYFYRLKQIETDGRFFYYDTIFVNFTPTSVKTFKENQFDKIECFPNPFNGTTKISFYLDKKDDVILEIFSIDGNLIETLIKSTLLPGKYNYQWTPLNQTSGVYLARIKNSEKIFIQKLLYLK